jgi:hypothetical protein
MRLRRDNTALAAFVGRKTARPAPASWLKSARRGSFYSVRRDGSVGLGALSVRFDPPTNGPPAFMTLE